MAWLLLAIGVLCPLSKSATVEVATPADFAKSSCDHANRARAAFTCLGVTTASSLTIVIEFI
jgi:hypothetical protein